MRAAIGIVVGIGLAITSSAFGQTAFVAQLTGAANVPAVGTSTKGGALAVLDPATATVKYQLDLTNLSGSVTSVDANNAVVGSNGPLVFSLTGVAPHFAGTSPSLTPSQVAELQAGHFYLTVRTTTNPGGLIRGQLTMGANQFYSLMTGAKAVPPSPTPVVGYANFGLLGNGIQLTAMIHASFQGGTATLKQGAPGVAGATIVSIPYDASGVWNGVVALDPVRLEMLKAGLVYLEVASGTSVIRGQLYSTFAQYGTGCGVPAPTLLAQGNPTPNSYISMTLNGGVPFSIALLFVAPNAGLASSAGCPLYFALPAPLALTVPLDYKGSGYISLVQIPASIPTPLFIQSQALFANPAAANGQYTASNGVTFDIATYPD